MTSLPTNNLLRILAVFFCGFTRNCVNLRILSGPNPVQHAAWSPWRWCGAVVVVYVLVVVVANVWRWVERAVDIVVVFVMVPVVEVLLV